MIQSPDLDKLVRSVLDALTGYAYIDDRQVGSLVASKEWTGPDDKAYPYTHIYISGVTP